MLSGPWSDDSLRQGVGHERPLAAGGYLATYLTIGQLIASRGRKV